MMIESVGFFKTDATCGFLIIDEDCELRGKWCANASVCVCVQFGCNVRMHVPIRAVHDFFSRCFVCASDYLFISY